MEAQIKPSDLRIGNLVTVNDLIVVVHKIESDRFWATHNELLFFQGIDVSQIPLTEEWLLRIKQAIPESYLNLSYVINSNTKIWVDKSNENNFKWHYVWMTKYIEIKYLHNLQNIHYYLNNFEELTLKE